MRLVIISFQNCIVRSKLFITEQVNFILSFLKMTQRQKRYTFSFSPMYRLQTDYCNKLFVYFRPVGYYATFCHSNAEAATNYVI